MDVQREEGEGPGDIVHGSAAQGGRYDRRPTVEVVHDAMP